MKDQLYRVRFYYEEDASWADPRDNHNVGTMACWHRHYSLGDEQPKGHYSPEEYWPDKLLEVIPAQPTKEWLAGRPDTRLFLWLNNVIYWDSRDPIADQDDWDYVKDAIWEDIEKARLGEDRSIASEAWDAYRTLQKVRKKYDSVSEWISDLVDEYFCVLDLYLYDHSGITMSTRPFSCPWDSGKVGFIYAPWDPKAPSGKHGEPHGITDPEKLKAALVQEVETYDLYLTGQVYGFEIQKGERVTVRTSKTRADGTVEETCHDTIEWKHWDSCGGYVADYKELPALVLHNAVQGQAAAHRALLHSVWSCVLHLSNVPKELEELFKPMLDSALERLEYPTGEWAYSPAANSEGED